MSSHMHHININNNNNNNNQKYLHGSKDISTTSNAQPSSTNTTTTTTNNNNYQPKYKLSSINNNNLLPTPPSTLTLSNKLTNHQQQQQPQHHSSNHNIPSLTINLNSQTASTIINNINNKIKQQQQQLSHSYNIPSQKSSTSPLLIRKSNSSTSNYHNINNSTTSLNTATAAAAAGTTTTTTNSSLNNNQQFKTNLDHIITTASLPASPIAPKRSSQKSPILLLQQARKSSQQQQQQQTTSNYKPSTINTNNLRTHNSHIFNTIAHNRHHNYKMKIIPSPTIRIFDLFKYFLKNVPKNSEIIEGPALCITYDSTLKDEHWDEIFICNNVNNNNDDESINQHKLSTSSPYKQTSSSISSSSTPSSSSTTNPASPKSASQNAAASKFISFFHISDSVAILSGSKVAFIDPYERLTSNSGTAASASSQPQLNDEHSYCAIINLDHDFEEFEEQIKGLEKLFNVPLLKTRKYDGTIIRLPLRTHASTYNVSNKLIHTRELLTNAKDFMKEAHLHILFSKNLASIQFIRTKDGFNMEKIYSIQVEDQCMEQFKLKYKKVNESISEGEFPSTSTITVTIRKQIEAKSEKIEWILSIFADTMRLLNSNYFLMKIAIPISDNYDKDIRFSHKSNLISSDTGFIKVLHLSKPIICYIEDKEGILLSHFTRLNISDSLKLSHFNDAYALMLKDLTLITRKDPTLLWSLMPNIEKHTEFQELLAEIWVEISKHQLFYSRTEGWGYVGIEDMIINDVCFTLANENDKTKLETILTYIYSSSNYPVVIMPEHVFKALQKYAPKDSLQVMTPSQTSDILHNSLNLIEQLKQDEKIELLQYLLKDQQPRSILDLPLLLLESQKFIRFQSPLTLSSSSKATNSQSAAKYTVFIVDKEYLKLFLNDNSHLFVNTNLPKPVLQTLKLPEFQKATQVRMISEQEFPDLINLPKEWKNGEEKIIWTKTSEPYNIDWLENLWKYLNEYHQNDLTIVENLNIIYSPIQTPTMSSASSHRLGLTKEIPPIVNSTTPLILYKLSKNSNLIYTPPYASYAALDATTTTTTNSLHNTTTAYIVGIEQQQQQQQQEAYDDINETTYYSLIKILQKLGFTCIDQLTQLILKNKQFFNYVPNIRKSRINLLNAFKNKYMHTSMQKKTQDFNLLLNESDIKLIRDYISKIEFTNKEMTKEHVEIIKELPIFDNGSLECTDRYLPIKECSLIYESMPIIRIPFELKNLKPYICVVDIETRYLIEDKLNINIIKEFQHIIKDILKYLLNKELNSLSAYKIHCLGKWILHNYSNITGLDSGSSSSNNANSSSSSSASSSSNLNNDYLTDLIKNAKLFMNQKQELCSITQFLNVTPKYQQLFDLKYLPANDLLTDDKCLQQLIKQFKMRNNLQLRVDEITDLYDNSIKQADDYRRLFAELIIDILISKLQENIDSTASIDKYLSEYSTVKAVSLRHFLMSVDWIPLQRDRPASYPQTLIWKDSEPITTTTVGGATTNVPGNRNSSASQTTIYSTRIRFSSPRDCVDSQYAHCAGSVAYVSDLQIPHELKSYIDLKQVHLDLIVRHLKITTKCFETSAFKAEWYDYLTVAKRCYEFMGAYEMQDIYRELKANDLNEWIWNGSGFSSITSIFIIDKEHPLSTHVQILPNELYVCLKFFERIGMKRQPDIKQLEDILMKCVKNSKLPGAGTGKQANSNEQQLTLENAAKNYPLISWIKQNFNEKKLLNIIKEYEENLAHLSAINSTTSSSSNNGPNLTPFIVQPTTGNMNAPTSAGGPQSATGQTKFSFQTTDFNDNPDYIYLYLPELYKSTEIKDNIIASVKLVKNRHIVILDEEAYLARKIAAAALASQQTTNQQSQSQNNLNMGSQNGLNNGTSTHHSSNIYDHYRIYNEIILPNLNNLNSLNKTIKDSVVLFALDHADPKMLEILRDHACIPVQPSGRTLRKPNKLVHPHGKIAPLYSDSDGRFPCGSEETYLREDRLQILKILGMKCDTLNWQELIERAESVSKIREYEPALERAIAVLHLLNEMLAASSATHTFSGATSTEHREEKEGRLKACELMRDIPFIPVKSKPYKKLSLVYFGDKYKYRFAKPKEMISSTYENICSCTWPVPLQEYKKKECIVSKLVEQFLAIDDLDVKITLKDVLKQLDEVSKLHIQEIDDQKELKLISDICFQVYEYLQIECQKRPNENIEMVRNFFVDRRCILLNEEFVGVHQLCWELNVNLKSLFYQMPTSFLRSFKYLFNQVLNIKVHLDLPDLLHVVDSMKRKYKENAIANKDDFNILMNVYALIIDQGYQHITNLYLPNVNSVLYPGRTLYFYPICVDQLDKPEEYVHPAVDRRVCVIAGATMKKSEVVETHPITAIPVQQQQAQNAALQLAAPNSLAVQQAAGANLTRIFPRVFGNKRLEGILARLDDEKIDIQYINNMDEGNPQIVLNYMLEVNRIHSTNLGAYLSDDDIYIILKYFNDFLARNYPAINMFNRIKELKIFKPLWSDKYIHLNFLATPPSTPTTPKTPTNESVNAAAAANAANTPNVYLVSEEIATLMKRSFKQNPFLSAKSGHLHHTYHATTTTVADYQSPIIILIRRNELIKLYSYLNFINLNDLEAFLHLCLPQFRKLDAKSQANFLKYLYDDILEKCYTHDKEKCFKILRDKLYIQSRKGEQQLISDLYDMKNESLKNILNDSYFPDENFDSPQCLRFLKEAGLRTFLPSDLCKRCMNEIEEKVQKTDATGGWTEELRTRSRWLYQHLIDNWQRFDDSVLQQRFLEPHCPEKRYLTLAQPFEYKEFKHTCIKLSDAEICKYEKLVWSSSFVLPSFVNIDLLDMGALEYLKLNRQPCFALVNQHLTNICETISNTTNSKNATIDATVEETLIEVLKKCYQYLDDLNNKETYKQLEDKTVIWSVSTHSFVSPNRICIELDECDEIPPFVYTLSKTFYEYKSLFIKLGSKEKPYAMIYGDILRKMAKVCGDDYLNSNEICKAIKSMECFFKYLSKTSNPNAPDAATSSSNTTTNGANESMSSKLPGLYLITTELKLEKSSSIVIIDDRINLDYIPKLPSEKFLFNPSERIFKMLTNEIKPTIDKIFVSQRPTLFSQKYEEIYDISLPDDPDSQRQILLTSLERKYQQIFTSRQLHRCLARCIANEEARRISPKHLPIDDLEKEIRERLSAIKVVCVEYLETSLCLRRQQAQQKIDQTVEERACYMTNESSGAQFNTLYLSKKHIEQPYFPLCLARSLQPLFTDLRIDYSILSSLIATSVSQMARLLQLVNVASEENILSVVKLQYIPSSGKLYADDVSLLAPFDPKLHNVLPGDLCVYMTAEGVYLYCQVIEIKLHIKQEAGGKHHHHHHHHSGHNNHQNDKIEYTFIVQCDENGDVKKEIDQKDFYVLENWHRIYDALNAKPPDERESFKYQDNANGNVPGSSASSEGRRTPGDGEENFSDTSDKSETSSMYDSNESLSGGGAINQIELEQAKAEVNQELRQLWSLEENDKKKKINRLLLKWHPDKNTGKEKFASEVFKHLKKQIEFYKSDPFLSSFYRSNYTGSYSGFGSSPTSSSYTYNASTGATGGAGGTGSTDDYKSSSRHYGSFDDLHRKNSNASATGSDGKPDVGGSSTGAGMPGGSPNLGRSGSFRQDWERRRQHRTGTDSRGDRSSPSGSRRRGTDFTQMDANLWFSQAKADLDSANNDMHPITGKPAYEWVCYKCYRSVEKALRAYHYFKGNGKLPASDIHGLLLGVESNIRDIAFRFCNFIGNEANAMQYPGISRFGKTPNEVFPLTKAEQAIDYTKELIKLVEDIIYAT